MRKRSVPVLLPTFLVLGVLGAWAGTSMGQVPPIPTVSLPTVTVPSAPLPVPPPPPVPTVTTPQVELPTPPAVPPAPVPLPVTVPQPDTPVSPLPVQTSPFAPASTGTGTAPAERHFGASSRIATISRFRVSRRWVAAHGSLAGRGVWISFWLSRPGTVVFLVDELAPECRYVGNFLVRGRSGRNEVRFRGRVGGQALDVGTYRLTAHPRGDQGRRLTGVTVVMLEHPPGPAEIAAAHARNTCPGGVPPSMRAAGVAAAADRDDTTGGVAGVQASSAARQPFVEESPGPLGAAVDTIQSAAEAVPPVLFALAALAVLLLAVAAMPQPVRASRAGAALVHHRGTIALAGVGVLIAAFLSFTLLS